MIFIVEDDIKIAALVADFLAASGYQTRHFPDGRSVVAEVKAARPTAVILDLMLPASDGITVCRQIRTFSDVPIIMLTARVEEKSKLEGLGCGADDYVTKPFSPAELVARLEALLRRAQGRVTTNPEGLAYLVDEAGQRIAWSGRWLDLSPSEYRIFAAMIQRPGQVFSRDHLLDHLGDNALESTDRAIDSHIKNLRRKITAVDAEAACIASVYGAGYRFDPPALDLKN
ncbi:MAG: response regulator [Pseudomonadota bacterium]